VIDELDYDRPWDRVALSRDGYLFIAPDRNRYLIEVFAPGGELQHTIDQDADGLERSSEQLAAVRRDLQAQVRYDKSPPREIRVCSTEPCVTGLWPRPNGSLWVRTSQGDHQARTVGAIVLDAYDEKGQFQNQVLLDFPFDPAADTLHPLGPDRVLIVCGGRDAALERKGNVIPNESTELPTIVCYQIEEDAN